MGERTYFCYKQVAFIVFFVFKAMMKIYLQPICKDN